MSRISDRFEMLKRDGGKGFIPFITAGDPDHDTSLSILQKLAELSADVIEMGVPFSDPMADGPTIQLSSQRSLERGTTLQSVIDLAAEFRAASDTPLVLFSYLNPVLRYGLDRFASAAEKARIDGVLFTDVIEDEADAISAILADHGIDLISLVAPTTTDLRLQAICSNARGFVYAVSRAGVTGARETTSDAAETLVRRIRNFSDLPIAVGFGISTRKQIADVWRYADAAVVGSAIVERVSAAASPDEAVEAVETFVRALLPPFAKNRIDT
ncbi:MAG: tryptophan synthase subunit alpha [Pyrinomonadaceae bacterium]